MRLKKIESAKKSYALYTGGTPAKWGLFSDRGELIAVVYGRCPQYQRRVRWHVKTADGEIVSPVAGLNSRDEAVDLAKKLPHNALADAGRDAG